MHRSLVAAKLHTGSMLSVDGHHLIMGDLIDVVTGEILPDTHDERYRQAIGRMLMESKGYQRSNLQPRCELLVQADNKKAIIKIDYKIWLNSASAMIIKYGPGSLVTRHRPALAAARLLEPYQIPIAVVTNGEDADILEGRSGKILFQGLSAIPSRARLGDLIAHYLPEPISAQRAEMESRILYCYEVDGSCPCDDTVCRL